MDSHTLFDILSVAEKLKCNTRHSYTSSGRQESVAEHCWRLSFMAMLLSDEFKNADMNKVIKMCIIHDLGEAFTGDTPAFYKKASDTQAEDNILLEWFEKIPSPHKEEFKELLFEMQALESEEAKIFKALDNLEAVIQHNEADISTWIPLEYDFQLTYGADKVTFSSYLTNLKKDIDKWTLKKISDSKVN